MRVFQAVLLLFFIAFARSCEVTFWGDADFNGETSTFQQDNNDLPGSIYGVVSSLSVSTGCGIRAYSESNFNGDRSFFMGKINNLKGAYKFNDKIRSFKIVDLDSYDCAVIMYSDADFVGNANLYTETAAKTLFHNDYYSSLRIVGRSKNNCGVVTYEDHWFQADMRYFGSDSSRLDDFNDKVSSIKIINKNACAIVFYENTDFCGHARYYDSSRNSLGNQNDHFSSFETLGTSTCHYEIFNDVNRPAGQAHFSCNGRVSKSQMDGGIGNDEVSSFYIGN